MNKMLQKFFSEQTCLVMQGSGSKGFRLLGTGLRVSSGFIV